MNTYDEAQNLQNPRLLSAVYFGLLSIIAVLASDALLYALGVGKLLSLSKAIGLSMCTAALVGALFGKTILHSNITHRTHTFLIGFLMVITAYPFYNLGFLYLLRDNHPSLFAHASTTHLIDMYFYTLGYGFLISGFWVAIYSGLAAIYLRKHVVYYVVRSVNQRRRNAPERETEDTEKPNADDTK